MLFTAARHALDRLVSTMMTLVEAIAPNGTLARPSPLTGAATQALFHRLVMLVPQLIRIQRFGLRASPASNPQAPIPAPVARPSRTPRRKGVNSLPRRPGWLLAAIPEIADPVAAEIRALLADPALAALLDRARTLRRALRPLLRSLGLDAAAAPATTPQPAPSPGARQASAPPRASSPPLPTPVAKLA